jgi:hypothetical protein
VSWGLAFDEPAEPRDNLKALRMLLRYLFVILSGASISFAQDSFEDVERIVAIGDVHGDLDAFTGLLRTAKLVDNRNNWTGGKTHLVIPGDFIDRGNNSRKVMDLLMALEPQAQKAGGRGDALLGNHEAMNLYGDLRYVTRADYDAFRGPDSADLREQALQSALQQSRGSGRTQLDTPAFRKKFEDEHPLGAVERAAAFSASGKYGKWLRQKNAILKINDIVFVHGGISAKYSLATMKFINDTVHAELADFSKLEGGVAMDQEGPLWYRGLADSPETDMAVSAALDDFLKNQQARHIVIGHTPQAAVMPRFQGRVIVIDVGLSAFFGGSPAYLLVDNSKFYAVHRGKQLDLPVDGRNVMQYLNAAAALDPPDSQLRRVLSKGGR